MGMDDVAKTSSPPNGNGNGNGKHPHKKLDVYHEVVHRLREAHVPESLAADFEDDLWNHFHRFPARYAMDVNVDRAEDVLMHQQLLEKARDPANRPALSVKVVQVPVLDEDETDFDASTTEEGISPLKRKSTHPPPAFGSSVNLAVLASDLEGDDDRFFSRPMHEITFALDDRPKLLNQLTSLLGGLGLNIEEAHAFSTNDGYSLDVFLVSGWNHQETEELKQALENKLHTIEAESIYAPWPELEDEAEKGPLCDRVQIPRDGTDEWEIDLNLLKFENKVASGTYGDLYRGTYCNQDVAIKVLKPERLNENMQQEFAHEIFIMRKVRHKNVVQFIGACTQPSNLCIVTEFMKKGSVYDHLHKQKVAFKLPALLKAAIDISKGMDYLHQNKIIHRDLKTANLLMDENEVVKVADFGVARVKAQSGIMTAETGTYRWMAPEVIEHKPYDQKADVFSFGIVLWELLTGKIPYEYQTPLQAAIGVVQKGLRPTIPKNTHPKLAQLLEKCWQQDPEKRPTFMKILEDLQEIAKEVMAETDDRGKVKEKQSGGLLSGLIRGR